jgi:uncharacterized tellurite resistance protein B-like protein
MNYGLLLLAHIICADQQLHSEEIRYLDELIKGTGADKATIEAIENIFSQSENHPSLEECAKSVTREDRQHLLQPILEVTYADGYLAPLEKIAIDQIIEIWKFPKTKVDQAIANAEQYYRTHRKNNLSDNEKADLSISAKVVKVTQTVFSRGLVKKIAEVAPSEIGQKIERLQREVLLAGPEYDEAVLRFAKIAAEDYEFAKSRLEQTEKALEDLQVSINRQTQELQKSLMAGGRSGSAKEVIKQINATKEALESKIVQQLQKIRASLDAKSRALSHFSITFMGKTKAGKSTLHAVVTGEGWNAIGVGKQRTTRYNRVYEWKNIRIIDTPGIGAPGGKSDEEVAESVIDESDVICYVVTNDSVQESEFKFLEVLEANAKPLIVLMNLKRNLRDSRFLKGFLESPDKLFAMQGNNTLQGHFNRIRTYAEKHYRNNAFEIIPVMLLAAQMSKEKEHNEIKEKLLEASRLRDFLDIIRESIVTNGTIRRSQTFLGSTAGKIGMPLEQINLEIKAYQHLLSELKKKRDRVRQEVNSQEDNARRLLQNKVKTIFKRLESCGESFILSVKRHIIRNLIYLYALENNREIPLGSQDSAIMDTSVNDSDSDLPTVNYTMLTAKIYDQYKTKYIKKFKWLRSDLFHPNLEEVLRQDIEALEKVLNLCPKWQASEDRKLKQLINLLKVQKPTQKFLIFSQFADTVNFLIKEIKGEGIKKCESVTGATDDPTDLVNRFSPRSNNQSNVSADQELRILISTDILSEGQNLQDSTIVVN